jgi:hypothetical protein
MCINIILLGGTVEFLFTHNESLWTRTNAYDLPETMSGAEVCSVSATERSRVSFTTVRNAVVSPASDVSLDVVSLSHHLSSIFGTAFLVHFPVRPPCMSLLAGVLWMYSMESWGSSIFTLLATNHRLVVMLLSCGPPRFVFLAYIPVVPSPWNGKSRVF